MPIAPAGKNPQPNFFGAQPAPMQAPQGAQHGQLPRMQPNAALPPRDNRRAGDGSGASELRGQAIVELKPVLLAAQSADGKITPLGKTNVILSKQVSLTPQKDAEITARLITMLSAQDKISARTPQAAALPKESVLSKLLMGKLDHVYLTNDEYKAFAKNSRSIDGYPDKYPVFVDNKKNRLVVNLDHAFAKGDELSADAIVGLSKAVGPEARLPASKKLAQQYIESQSGPPLPVPVYGGKKISSTTKGADFYKQRDSGVPGLEEWVKDNRGTYSHPDYFKAPPGENLKRKEVIVHRGLIDNRNGIPENSIAAIDNCIAQGYLGIELDVQIAKDGKPILMHDFTAGRVTDDPKNRLTYDIHSDELTKKNLVIRNPATGDFVETDQKVPTLKQALDHISSKKVGMAVTLDCKETAAEQPIILLLENPQLQPTTAVKFYSKTYKGGFDQLLGNLQKHYGIHPSDPSDQPRREKLLHDLKGVNLVPILSQENLLDKDLLKFFPPSAGHKNPLANPANLGAEALAQSGKAWLKSWEAMRPVVVEVVPTNDKADGKAMSLIREQLRTSSDQYATVPFSGSYRAADFSVAQKDGSSKFFTWTVHGGMTEVPEEPIHRKRDSAGSFHAADILLTDEPDREMWAISHDIDLPRGHTGFKMDFPPGTLIDTKRNAENIKYQLEEFKLEKIFPDEDLIVDVAKGRQADQLGGATGPRIGLRGAVGAVLATGVAALAVVKRENIGRGVAEAARIANAMVPGTSRPLEQQLDVATAALLPAQEQVGIMPSDTENPDRPHRD
jgi:Glycerophosphoryl diester phosphodiesterase family